MFFLRWTSNPEGDAERGWSGYMQAWYDSEDEAWEAYQKRIDDGNILPSEPKEDSLSGMWNSEPEAGLSGYGFKDEASFQQAMKNIRDIAWYHQEDNNQNLWLFKGTELPEQGADGEDLFSDVEPIKEIYLDSTYQDVVGTMKEVRAIIRGVLQERFGFNNNKNYNVPMDVKSAAQKAIAAGGQTANGGNEGSGKRKAQELANGTPQSHAQMKRLKAFFDANQPGSPEWGLHGGDAAKRWVDSALNSTHNDNMRTKENMRRLGGGGHGMNDGMGSMSATMMKTNNTRNHSVWTRAKNRMQEAVIDKDGNLIGFSFNEEDAEEFHAQWGMWLQEQAGEVVNGFVLTFDGLSVEWIGENDDYVIRADVFPYPDYESKMIIQLYKEDQFHYYQEFAVDKDLMFDNGPDRIWEVYKKNLINFIEEAKRQGKFLDI